MFALKLLEFSLFIFLWIVKTIKWFLILARKKPEIISHRKLLVLETKIEVPGLPELGQFVVL